MPTEAHMGGPHILQKTKDIVASYLEKGPEQVLPHFSAGMVDPDKGEIFLCWAATLIMQAPSSKRKSKKALLFLALK